MKYHLPLLFFILLCPLLKATSLSMSTIPQPANLVGDSIPGCIPLTSAVCVANYTYGIHKMISAPHPFLRDAKEWKRGTESDSNLASVFGIRVRPTDETSVPYAPVEIHIKDWDIPAYSPHTKAEVLAATIHCLLLSSGPSPDHPLDLRIVTENDKDLAWAKPFEKIYITRPGNDQKPVKPTPVGNSFVKTDGYGIRYVICKKLNPKHLTPSIHPAILPISFEDDSMFAAFIPVWPGKEYSNPEYHALHCLALPNGHLHSLFPNGLKRSPESNPLLTDKQSFSIKSHSTNDAVEVYMTTFNQPLESLTCGIAAAALTTRINHGKPMRITIESHFDNSKLIKALLETPGWEKSKIGDQIRATTLFDYDPKTKSLIKGTLPTGPIISASSDGQIYLKHKEQ